MPRIGPRKLSRAAPKMRRVVPIWACQLPLRRNYGTQCEIVWPGRAQRFQGQPERCIFCKGAMKPCADCRSGLILGSRGSPRAVALIMSSGATKISPSVAVSISQGGGETRSSRPGMAGEALTLL